MKHINGNAVVKPQMATRNKSVTSPSRISESNQRPHRNQPSTMLNYLADLNPEQRRAVEYGIRLGNSMDAGPLLVIAGAGSGKTKTLAYRVAHLVVNGVDPQRIASADLYKAGSRGDDSTSRADHNGGGWSSTSIDLPWAGTFHAVGARLLREFAQPHWPQAVVYDSGSVGCG